MWRKKKIKKNTEEIENNVWPKSNKKLMLRCYSHFFLFYVVCLLNASVVHIIFNLSMMSLFENLKAKQFISMSLMTSHWIVAARRNEQTQNIRVKPSNCPQKWYTESKIWHNHNFALFKMNEAKKQTNCEIGKIYLEWATSSTTLKTTHFQLRKKKQIKSKMIFYACDSYMKTISIKQIWHFDE